METLVMAIGIILIVEGSINLLSALYTVLAVRRFAKLHPETQSMLESLTGEDLNLSLIHISCSCLQSGWAAAP